MGSNIDEQKGTYFSLAEKYRFLFGADRVSDETNARNLDWLHRARVAIEELISEYLGWDSRIWTHTSHDFVKDDPSARRVEVTYGKARLPK